MLLQQLQVIERAAELEVRLVDGNETGARTADRGDGLCGHVLARTPWSGDEAFRLLADRGLVVRTFAHDPLLADCIRACVALPDDDARLVAVLGELLAAS